VGEAAIAVAIGDAGARAAPQTRRSRRRWESSKRPEPPTPSPRNEAPNSFTTTRDLTDVSNGDVLYQSFP
jgi:hypothetical protein